MRHNILTVLMTAAVLTALTACSADDGTAGSPRQQGATTLQLAAVTRSGDGGDDGLEDIRLYMARDDRNGEYYEGMYERTATEPYWKYLVSITPDVYHIYGYMPADIVTTASLAQRTDAANHYQDGAVLTLKELPAVTQRNVCIITSVKKPDEATFSTGNFCYDNRDNTSKVCLHLEHLYASVCFKLALGSSRNYSSLRSIKVRELSLKATAQQQLVVSVKQGAGIDNVTATPAADIGTFPVFSGESSMLEAPTDTVTVTAYFLPEVTGSLRLVASYDVYDKKNTDKALREVRGLENKLTLPEDLKRGEQRIVKLTIEPTYLYQLSDDDLDNPTIKVQ